MKFPASYANKTMFFQKWKTGRSTKSCMEVGRNVSGEDAGKSVEG
jgi:hypothetical protein